VGEVDRKDVAHVGGGVQAECEELAAGGEQGG